jgi:hypothetical protein
VSLLKIESKSRIKLVIKLLPSHLFSFSPSLIECKMCLRSFSLGPRIITLMKVKVEKRNIKVVCENVQLNRMKTQENQFSIFQFSGEKMSFQNFV